MWGCGSGHLAPDAAGDPQAALGSSLPIPGPQLSQEGLVQEGSGGLANF